MQVGTENSQLAGGLREWRLILLWFVAVAVLRAISVWT